jgi:hypothetical protein
VGVGSRGINNLVPAVRALTGVLKAAGAQPFIVPAMGSHGGASAEGQRSILADYGVTEESVGAPVRATMETVETGELDDGYPVYFDAYAYAADAVVVVNRIKPHTDFSGVIESGLAKMCAIGLGKQKGASTIHRFGADGLRTIMPKVARRLIETTNIVGGVGLIENAYGQTAEVHCLLAATEMGLEPEAALLNRARMLTPRIPFQEIDVLVVDEMGKNISGAGMDTHVIGRLRMPSGGEESWDGPNVRIVCTLDLTEESHGNAAGIGLADMITRRLIEKTDLHATFINHRTSGEGGIYRGSIPIILEDGAACVKAAIGGCGKGRRDQVRIVRIRNTEFVERLEVSENMLQEIRTREDLEVLDEPHHPDFETHLTLGAPH